MRTGPILIAAMLLALPVLGGCADFDMDKLDVFNLNKEKKLPGERKPLFPEGVPGVTQGIPPDLVKGYKPPEVAEVPPAPEPEKPKPRVVRRAPNPAPQQQQAKPASKPAPKSVSKPAPQQAQKQPPAQAWPDPPKAKPQAQQSWPAPAQHQPSAWPAPPPPNTFQR
jgi:hypothetical protein